MTVAVVEVAIVVERAAAAYSKVCPICVVVAKAVVAFANTILYAVLVLVTNRTPVAPLTISVLVAAGLLTAHIVVDATLKGFPVGHLCSPLKKKQSPSVTLSDCAPTILSITVFPFGNIYAPIAIIARIATVRNHVVFFIFLLRLAFVFHNYIVWLFY